MFLQLTNAHVKHFDKLVYVTKIRVIAKLENVVTAPLPIPGIRFHLSTPLIIVKQIRKIIKLIDYIFN